MTYRRGQKGIIPTCHPDRKHRSLGLCAACYRAEYFKNGTAEKRRAVYVKRTYQITDELALVAEQDWCCAACGSEDAEDINFHIDHDHACCPGVKSCGECVRGALCASCNSILGIANDDIMKLDLLIIYLEEWNMARKSDYTGDSFGPWEVLGRVEKREDWMLPGKRYWSVKNVETGEERTTMQTELPLLAKEADDNELLALATTPSVEPDWAAGLEEEDHQLYELPEDLGEAPEIGYVGELNADGKIPGNNKGDLNLKPDWAERAAALHTGPKLDGPNPHRHPSPRVGETGALRVEAITDSGEVLGVVEVDADSPLLLQPDEREMLVELREQLNVVTRFGTIGEGAEDGVSEAELDTRVAPADPIRTLIRKLLGEIHIIREQADALHEQVDGLRTQADGIMQLADQLLKLHIIK